MSRYSKLITNYIYMYHLDKYCIIPMYPDSITDNMPSSFNSSNALARSAPTLTYQNSGPMTKQITLKMHRDMMNDVNVNVSNLKSDVRNDITDDDYVDTLVKCLQACSVPRYKNFTTGDKSIIPPMVAVRFGNDIFIKGVITSGIATTYQKPILYNNKYAIVEITFTVTEVDPFDADTIMNDGSFRGITKSFKEGVFTSEAASNLYTNTRFESSKNTDILNQTVTKNNITYNSKKKFDVNGQGR